MSTSATSRLEAGAIERIGVVLVGERPHPEAQFVVLDVSGRCET